MEILSISISQLRQLEFQGRKAETGICKEPITKPVYVSKMGIEGDAQADLKNHGGVDKAVYAYSVENYHYWEGELSRQFPHGQFGENLTVSGLTDELVHIGDRFRFGPVAMEVTQPRVPCFKLGMRMGDNQFVGRFHLSGRVGFYLRVLSEGTLQTGDPIERISTDPSQLSIKEAMLALNKNPRQQEIIAKALEIPALSKVWREDLEKKRR